MSTVVHVYIYLLSILNNLFYIYKKKKTQWIILNLRVADHFQTIIHVVLILNTFVD